MTKEQEILEEISGYSVIGLDGRTYPGRNFISPEKLAHYLARMESTKSEERVGLLETAYRHGGKEGVEYVQSSEEKKCCFACCKIHDQHADCADLRYGCECPCHSPTPPDAWEEFCDLWDKCFPTEGDTRCRVQRDEILDWLHSKKESWEREGYKRGREEATKGWGHQKREWRRQGRKEARTTTLDELATYIQDQLEEANSQGTYKYDWLYEDLLTRLKEMRTKQRV